MARDKSRQNAARHKYVKHLLGYKNTVRERQRQRQRDRERERETETERQRQTDRERDRERERQRQRDRERHRERAREREKMGVGGRGETHSKYCFKLPFTGCHRRPVSHGGSWPTGERDTTCGRIRGGPPPEPSATHAASPYSGRLLSTLITRPKGG